MDPTPAPIRVERAAPARLPVLAGVLGRAFADEPMIQWPLGGGTTVETITQIFRLLYAGCCGNAVTVRALYADDDGIVVLGSPA